MSSAILTFSTFWLSVCAGPDRGEEVVGKRFLRLRRCITKVWHVIVTLPLCQFDLFLLAVMISWMIARAVGSLSS